MRQPPNPAVYEMAEGLRSAGATWQEVADILGVHYVTVYRWKRDGFVRDVPFKEEAKIGVRPAVPGHALKGQYFAITQDQIARAAQLREMGWPYHRIAQMVGCSKETVRLALLQNQEAEKGTDSRTFAQTSY